MINGIDLRAMRNAEFLQFHKDVAAIVQRNFPATLNVQQKYDAMRARLEEMESLFKKEMASDITPELLSMDERRDDAVNGIAQLVLAHTYHYKDELRQAANLLHNNIKLYGAGIARMNYQAETTTITSMLNDWNNKQPLADAVGVLGLMPWMKELAAANDQFNSRYLDRTQEISAANPNSLRSKRGEMNEAFYALRDRINALHTLSDASPSPYTNVISQINTLVDQYTQLLKTRAGHGASDETPATEQPAS